MSAKEARPEVKLLRRFLPPCMQPQVAVIKHTVFNKKRNIRGCNTNIAAKMSNSFILRSFINSTVFNGVCDLMSFYSFFWVYTATNTADAFLDAINKLNDLPIICRSTLLIASYYPHYRFTSPEKAPL